MGIHVGWGQKCQSAVQEKMNWIRGAGRCSGKMPQFLSPWKRLTPASSSVPWELSLLLTPAPGGFHMYNQESEPKYQN